MKFLQRYDSFSHIQEINERSKWFLTYTLKTFVTLSKNARCASIIAAGIKTIWTSESAVIQKQRGRPLFKHLRVRLYKKMGCKALWGIQTAATCRL